jgi:phosphoribosylanthranilate isomerase
VTPEQAKDIVQAVRNFGERTGRIDVAASSNKSSSNGDNNTGGSANNLPQLIRNTRALEAVATSRRPLVVGVFQNESSDNIAKFVEETGLDLIQLHGDEGMEACDSSKCGGVPAIRVVHMPPGDLGDASSRAQAIVNSLTSSHPQAILLDTSVKGSQGGTGVTFDWNVAEELQTRFGLPVLVAGGLKPDNVADVVTSTKPWGVDVSSGVEATPGKKDHDKVKAFVTGARQGALEASKGF